MLIFFGIFGLGMLGVILGCFASRGEKHAALPLPPRGRYRPMPDRMRNGPRPKASPAPPPPKWHECPRCGNQHS